ncbi:CD209 antigen-like protein C isoform X1 [Hemiscyllium ocellatum]|uniref:CD209 antigen-like protein C isoform X1 n=1 Tax=Hemiscyllium ocellatum TaxID=170820 RepID=UPI002966BE7B|nr:CD209 antigen-like protein C isoform X1 [Hemiscyllium ocellatum]
MELDNIYTNVNYDQVKQDRKQQNLKSDHGGVQSVQGKWSSLVIYIFLGISILLSVVTLITAVILFTQLFTIMKMLETDFKMGLAQLQHNVTQLSSDMKTLETDFKMDLAQMQNSKLSGKCPEDWRRFQQNCYYFSSESKTWTEAQRACASLDANLVVINKPEEQAFIKTLIQNKRYWIGLTDSISEGHWRWVDGMDYTSSVKFWSEGEPNNASDEDCAEIYSNGGWNDRSCDVSQQWICEKPAQLDSP